MVTATSDNSFEANGNLVLARKRNESFEIDGGITVKVVEIKNGLVRILVNAPKQTRVLRSELRDRNPVDKGQQCGKRAG